MKRSTAMVVVMTLCSASILVARQGGFSRPAATTTQSQNGGFIGPNGGNTTVKSTKSLHNDTQVTLRGNIVGRISDDLYVFEDAIGTVNMNIGHRHWNGVTVTPQGVARIQDEVDKD